MLSKRERARGRKQTLLVKDDGLQGQKWHGTVTNQKSGLRWYLA